MHPLSLFILLSLALSVLGCAGLFGGGGGCGCGCGGRKKRSIDSLPPPFTQLAAKDSDDLCNSPELKQTILQNMRENATESGKAISAVLEAMGDRFVVVCAEKKFDFFVRHDTEFCGARNGSFYCQAFAI